MWLGLGPNGPGPVDVDVLVRECRPQRAGIDGAVDRWDKRLQSVGAVGIVHVAKIIDRRLAGAQTPPAMARSANIATVVETELLEAPPLREQIYQRLRDAILTGQLPAGTRLSPARLAESFGVSTMPVREALRLLEDDGLIQTSPRRWTRVASPDPGLADEIYPLIGLLEDYALRTAPGAPVEQVQRARQANAALASAANRHDVLACLAADDSFHSVLVDLHPSPALRRTVADLKARTRLLEGAYFRFDDASTSVEEHNAVIDALVRGDMRQAGKSIAANWQHGLQKLRSVLAEPATDASDSRPPAISDPMDLESETLTAGP